MSNIMRVYISPVSKDDTNLKNGLPYFVRVVAVTANGAHYPDGGRAFFHADSVDGNYVIYGTNHLDGRFVPTTRVYRCLPTQTTSLPNLRRIFRRVIRREVKTYLARRQIGEEHLDDRSSSLGATLSEMLD